MTSTLTPARERSATRRMIALSLTDTAQKLRGIAPAQPSGTRSRVAGVADALDHLVERGNTGRGIAAGRFYQAAVQGVVRAQMLLDGANPVVSDILREALDDLDCAAEMMPRSGQAHLVPEALRGTILDPQIHPMRRGRGRDDPYAA